MASNDQWPPVAGKNSSKSRSNSSAKKPTKDHQQQVLSALTEMFQNTMESEVILSVAQSCDWELQSCIDALIALSSTVDQPPPKDSYLLVSGEPATYSDLSVQVLDPQILKMDEKELHKQQEEFKKFEKIKKTSAKNRMGSFRGSIPKLETSYKESGTFDSIWDPPQQRNPELDKTWDNNAPFALPQIPRSANPWNSDPLYLKTYTDTDKSPGSTGKPKKESELCGLKVQYRTAGMECSSEDDDADVVIEEELSGNIATSLPINVSQLLSSSIQSPPQVTCSYTTKTMTTASPPTTPKRSIHEATLERIKKTIKNGEKIVVILRGLPGSGKSYLAKSLISSTIGGNPSDYIFSADDFFIALGRGVYMYDPRKISHAHIMTQDNMLEAMKKEKTPIIIDNTNSQAWEMRPYAAFAVQFGYLVEILEPDTPWATKVNELVKRNEHWVPKNKIEQMLSRFEYGISGDKLLSMFSLRYRPENDPRIKKKAQECVVDQMGLNMPEELSEKKENKSMEEMEEKHLIFGAIGSERKNSVVSSEVPVIPDSTTEETSGTDDKISAQCAEILEQDEEFGKKRKRIDSPVEDDEREENGVRSAVENFLSELTQGYNNTGTFVAPTEGRQSADITEFEEKIQNVADIAASLLESSTMTAFEISEQNHATTENSFMKRLNDCEDENSETPINETEKSLDDEKVENSSGEDRDMSFIDAENLSDIETADEPQESTAQSTLGTIFNIIRTSILGNTTDEEPFESATTEIEEGKELKEFSILDDPVPSEIDNDRSESISIDIVSIIKSPISEITAAIDSTDDVSHPFIDESDRHQETEFYSFENESSELQMQQDHSAPKTLETPKKIEDSVPSDTESPVSLPASSEAEVIDNINRITWKESPFPVDDLVLPKVTIATENTPVPKVDASTNTTYYDFNVAYIGGTSEPMYRVIPAFNRLINENLPQSKPERPPVKLMLDKSSMTGDIFSGDVIPELESPEEKKDKFLELMELFPHIPKDYLLEIFEKVNQDLDWAVELLLEGVSEDIPIKLPDETTKFVEVLPIDIDDNSSSSVSSKLADSEEVVVDANISETGDSADIEDPALKQDQDEDVKAVDLKAYSDFTTPEPVNEPSSEVFDDTASSSTASLSRVESLEDEKSSESDDLVEVNLGFDCIKGLEKSLGIANFHIPEGFSPIIQIKKALAEELYANWVESLYHQANTRHEQLDQMMAKDAELARDLERIMEREGEGSGAEEISEPNLGEIMDMELALAKYKNELKSIVSRETPDDLAARLSRQMLHEAIPDLDPDIFNDILKAHNGNFKEAFEVVEMNTGKVILPCDTLKKQRILMDEVKKEDRDLREKELPVIVVTSRVKDDKTGYKKALAEARDSRQEAQRQLSLKIQNYNKAAEAYRKGCPGVAAYYSQVARLHTKNLDAAHAAAASAFVEAQSWNDEKILDLHNLFVSEALTALDEFLDYHFTKLTRTNRQSMKLFIITGRGARSNNGTSKIKPAVSQKLNSRNIKFSEDNPGCLKVTLHRKSGPTE